MQVQGVSHVMYPTADRGRAIEFLVGAMGGRLMERVPDITYVGFGDTLIEVADEDPDLDLTALGTPYAFGLAVDDLEGAVASAEAHGGSLAREISTPRSFSGRQATINVPGGAPIALREYDTTDGPHNLRWTPPA